MIHQLNDVQFARPVLQPLQAVCTVRCETLTAKIDTHTRTFTYSSRKLTVYLRIVLLSEAEVLPGDTISFQTCTGSITVAVKCTEVQLCTALRTTLCLTLREQLDPRAQSERDERTGF
jgi:hypothetical protein